MNFNFILIFILCTLILGFVIIWYTVIKDEEWDGLLIAAVCLFIAYGVCTLKNMAVKTEIHIEHPRKTISVRSSDNTGMDFKKAGYIKIFDRYFIVQDKNIVFPTEKYENRNLILKEESMNKVIFEITDPYK